MYSNAWGGLALSFFFFLIRHIHGLVYVLLEKKSLKMHFLLSTEVALVCTGPYGS